MAAVAIRDVNDKFSSYPSDGLTPVKLARIFKEADAGDPFRQMELFEEMESKDTHLFSQLQTRKLAGLQLGEQMGVLAFHLLEQLHLPEGVPGVRLLEYPGQLYRCQAVRRVAAEFIVHIPDGNRCHDGPPAFCHFRW